MNETDGLFTLLAMSLKSTALCDLFTALAILIAFMLIVAVYDALHPMHEYTDEYAEDHASSKLNSKLDQDEQNPW